MNRVHLILVAAAAALLTVMLLAGAAPAQTACAPRAAILERLAARYGEVPIAAGITDRTLMIEVLAARDGTTWTIIATSPTGTSCLIAAGEGWRTVTAEPRAPQT